MEERDLVLILGALNILQFAYWGWHTHTLINKLMSKNFAEYEQVKSGPKEDAPPFQNLDEEIEERDVLDELNGMVGSNT